MTKTEWEKGTGTKRWRDMVTRDEKLAKEAAKEPDTQCCFGKADIIRGRCPNASTRASTFYGYTHGLAWCDHHGHGDRTESYPHGEIPIEKK